MVASTLDNVNNCLYNLSAHIVLYFSSAEQSVNMAGCDIVLFLHDIL